jgi:GrpB-like predicted nucleotidyltransferase (UPF0157 family)
VEPAVYLISGPMAAGKTTVARLLAARFPRGVHLEGDLFRRSIVTGREEVASDLRPGAMEQLRLRYRLAAAAADTYAEAGFTVALEDVVPGPLLGEYRTIIRHRPCHVVVLFPSVEAVADRGAPRVGIWLDTTAMTPEETVDEILARTTTTRSPIVIADPDPGWPALFERLAAPVRAALAGLGARVDHVGSTAVPGLAAKPIVDMDVVVISRDDVPEAIERLRALGYVYQGDKGIAGREAFLPPRGAPEHHLYVVVGGSRPHADHTRFRDHLRRHPEVAAAYAACKRDLAARHGADRVAYTEAKTAFIAAARRAADPPGGV